MICNECKNNNVKFVDNSEIYGKSYGNGKAYLCADCGAYVGAHNNGQPLGNTANGVTRDLRSKCHESFDPIWKFGIVSRNKLYGRLASLLFIEKNDCHFGMFDSEMASKALKVMEIPEWYNMALWEGLDKDTIRSFYE